ncbi:hypothetical protein HDE_01853 [Halotydeus destructor]|nr:hypothetical protein HDE_01853 [Halotydeus destructor]
MSLVTPVRSLVSLTTSRPILLTSRSLGTKVDRDSDLSSEFRDCVKKTKVQICGDLWAQYKGLGRKRYRDAPPGGLTTEAEYFDNGCLVGHSSPTVLMVHGSPGSYGHFSSLIKQLTKLGVRVISPNLPTMALTKEHKHFRHSPQERLEYVKAVLNEASVQSLDLLACHSSGTFTGLRMFGDVQCPTPRSLALFNPLGYEVTLPMQPYWWSRGFIKSWQRPSIRFLQEKVGVPLLVKLGNPFAGNKLEDIVLGGHCLHYNDRQQFKQILEDLVKTKIKTLVVMSDNDSVMSRKMNENVLRTLSVNDNDVTVYDNDGQLELLGQNVGAVRVVRTRKGGHFSFLKYPDLINPVTINLIDSSVTLKETMRETSMNHSRMPTSEAEISLTSF